MDILLISPTVHGTGNLSTINRIKSHLEACGFGCSLLDTDSIKDASQFCELTASYKLIVALHAFKAGKFLTDVKQPYVIIFGGTDVNEMTKDEDKLKIMTKVITRKNCRHIVAFTTHMIEIAKTTWPQIDDKSFSVLPQAVTVVPSLFDFGSYLRNNGVECPEDSILFLNLSGIRPVKNPLYLVDTFVEIHKKSPDILYVIVGPMLDINYEKIFLEKINRSKGVVYVPQVSINDAHAAIKASFCLINSSEQEGMALTILEAMSLGVPVMARDIPGNRAMIQDGTTGLLYSSPQEFHAKMEDLIENSNLKQQIISNARLKINQCHNPEIEKAGYERIAKSIIG